MIEEQNQETLKSKKLLGYVNKFWSCFNKEERDEIFQVLIKALNRRDKNIERLIKTL